MIENKYEKVKLPTDKFREEVYNVVASIPFGKVITYGQIANLIGEPQHSRLVGYILHNVSEKLHLPCHRVVNAQGRTVPGWEEQKELLKLEEVQFKPNGNIDMRQSQWHYMDCEI